MPRIRVMYWRALLLAEQPPGRRAGCFSTKPPLAPVGTITAFLTICAFIRPRISVR